MKAWPASPLGPKAPSAMSNTPAAGFTVSAPPPPRRIEITRRSRSFAPWGTSSNVQHDQLDKSDADQQYRKRHVIVFEPMPIIGKHHVDPSIRTPRSQGRVAGNSQGEDKATVVLIDMYRTPVSGVLRRKDSGFAVCGENPAGVSRFAAKTGPAFRSLWRESDAADPSSTKMKKRRPHQG